mmetsp:Transcript_32916/g.79625  ORF Transcript_32916/g.79625 Transcript_32916/m.79625 type:complete len:135 (-) Transcript_32916:272-676(-)
MGILPQGESHFTYLQQQERSLHIKVRKTIALGDADTTSLAAWSTRRIGLNNMPRFLPWKAIFCFARRRRQIEKTDGIRRCRYYCSCLEYEEDWLGFNNMSLWEAIQCSLFFHWFCDYLTHSFNLLHNVQWQCAW